ncbi:DUF4181 domain-containing protein [Paenibacillus sp. F411]|uniref:DUF4181 domain-containing protein n=1 Tax=Paenibacillus sp. F411 TaxID=2820239 RepID=UPI001AAED367|nr:DUF4181 domain-containing protein [Paenibacillus sp. F411]MBO2944992.1 DUF4181 domain-containing protein [Paenibacillus sp. F411]
MRIYIGTFLLLACVQLFLKWKMVKPLDVGYGGEMYETNGYKPYIWTTITFTILCLAALWFIPPVNPLVSILLMLYLGVRGVFEYKYLRDTNKHMVSFWMTAIMLVVTVLFFIIWKVYYQ